MKKYFGGFLILGLLLLNVYIWSASTGGASEGFLTVVFLDVGQGDAIFIESPTGLQVLIDSGANNAVLRELGKVMSFQDRTIDVLLATHPDKDHIGGFDELINIMKFMSGTRGSGWVMFVYDKHVDKFNFSWVDEHHLGLLSSVHILIALDCWEHAYMIDYDTTGRSAYVDAYMKAINWSIPEKWFEDSM